MEMNWLEIVVLALIGLAAVGFVVVQILRVTGRVSEEVAEASEDWIAKWVSIGVYAAQQLYGEGNADDDVGVGKIKLQYVIDLLEMLGISVGVPERAMIEAAVFNLKQKTEEV